MPGIELDGRIRPGWTCGKLGGNASLLYARVKNLQPISFERAKFAVIGRCAAILRDRETREKMKPELDFRAPDAVKKGVLKRYLVALR